MRQTLVEAVNWTAWADLHSQVQPLSLFKLANPSTLPPPVNLRCIASVLYLLFQPHPSLHLQALGFWCFPYHSSYPPVILSGGFPFTPHIVQASVLPAVTRSEPRHVFAAVIKVSIMNCLIQMNCCRTMTVFSRFSTLWR